MRGNLPLSTQGVTKSALLPAKSWYNRVGNVPAIRKVAERPAQVIRRSHVWHLASSEIRIAGHFTFLAKAKIRLRARLGFFVFVRRLRLLERVQIDEC